MGKPEDYLANPTNVPRPLAQGYGARLDNTLLRIINDEENPVQIQYADMQSPRIRTGEDPEDAGAPDFGYKFARSDFTGGEGLDFAHRMENPENYRTRFWDSKGIDVFVPEPGEQRRLRLCREVDHIESVQSNGQAAVEIFDEKLFCADGEDVIVIENPSSSSFSSSTENIGTGLSAYGLVAFGGYLYAACGSDGIYRRDHDGNWEEYNTQDAYGIWAEKSRLFVVNSNELLEVPSDSPDDVEIVATTSSGSTWTDMTSVGDAIAASSSEGSIWFFTLAGEEDINLIPAAQVPLYSDIPVAVSGYRGLLFYLTYQRLETGYMARFWRGVFQQGDITETTLIREWGKTSAPLPHAPHSLEPHRGKIYMGIPEPEGTYLWKYDLETTGRVRDIGIEGVTGSIGGIKSFSNTIFYSINDDGLYRESRSHVESGYLILPLVDFFDGQRKSWASVDIDVPRLSDDERVRVYYSTDPDAINDPDHDSWREVVYVETQSPDEPIRFRRVSSRYLTLKVEFDRGEDHESTPTMRSISVDAYPGETDVMMQVPVNVSDRLERPGRRAVMVDNLGDITYRFLQSKHSRSVYFELYRPQERIMGTVVDVSERIPYVNKITGSVTYIANLVVRGRRVGRLTQALSPDLIGISFLGSEKEE